MTQDLTFLAAARRFTRRGFGASVLAATLAACGGGGGSDDAASAGPTLMAPPATAATLAQSGDEAMAAVQALNNSSAVLLRKSGALQGGSLFAPVGASGSPLNLRNTVARASREQAQARETVSCGDLGLTGCSGSVTFDTNLEGNPNVLPVGTYLTMSFNGLSGTYEGSAFSMSGSFRMDFLTAIDINTANFANASFRITLNNFSGTADGVSFGPETAVALYEFDAQSVPSVTIDGLRIRGLDNMVVNDDTNFTLNDVDLRTAHWGNAASYVDVDFSNWMVASGRPTNTSTATITAGANTSVGITVLSSSQNQVVYAVRVTVGGTFADYIVTATYTDNVPSYSVSSAV